MTLEKMTAKLTEANAVIPGKRLTFDFGETGIIVLDGVSNQISNAASADSDTTIAISWDDWIAVASGGLDPISAYMQGRLRIQGDMGLAMQAQAMFTQLKD